MADPEELDWSNDTETPPITPEDEGFVHGTTANRQQPVKYRNDSFAQSSRNDGGGVEIAKAKDASALPFRTLRSSDDSIEITQEDDTIDLKGTGGAGTPGHIIQDEGTPLTQRPRLNFIGAGVTASDNSNDNTTDVQILGGGGGGDMTKAVYDPTGVDGDAFDAKNHVGTNAATQNSIDAVQTNLSTHEALTNNPHSVTQAQVGVIIKHAIACTAEDGAVDTTGTVATFRAHEACSLKAGSAGVRASLTTEGDGLIEIDIHVNDVSIFSTTLTIDSGSRSSVGAAASPVISNAAIGDDDEIKVIVVQGNAAAQGLKVLLLGDPA